MKKCPECGFSNLDEAVYCLYCGHRLDGLLKCPRCFTMVDPRLGRCPKCGARIVGERTPKEPEAWERQRKEAEPSYQVGFTVYGLICLIASLFLVWGSYLWDGQLPLNPNSFGRADYFLFGQWKEALSLYKSGNVCALVTAVFSFLLAFGALAGTCTFSIMGIVRSVRELRKKRDCRFRTSGHLAIVFMIIISTSTLLRMLYEGDTGAPPDVRPGWTCWAALVLFAPLFLFYAAHVIVVSYRRSEKPLLASRIVGSLGLYLLPLFILLSGRFVYLIEGGRYGGMSALALFVERYEFLAGPKDLIGALVIQGMTLAFDLAVVLIASSLFVYLVVGFYGERGRTLYFKLSLNVIGAVLFVTAFLRLVLQLVIIIILPGLSGFEGTPVMMGSSAPLGAFLALLVSISALVSFLLAERFARRKRVLAKNSFAGPAS